MCFVLWDWLLLLVGFVFVCLFVLFVMLGIASLHLNSSCFCVLFDLYIYYYDCWFSLLMTCLICLEV